MGISRQILRIRELNGLSQEKFGALIGVSRQAVQKWESGATMPDITNICTIAKKFNVSADTLLLDSDERMLDELKYAQKILPQFDNEMYLGEAYSEQLLTEYRQSVDEGLDIERYEGLFTEISKLPAGEIKEKMSDLAFGIVHGASTRIDFEFREPSVYSEIRLQKSGNAEKNFSKPEKAEMLKKLEGAWYGRIVGCLLGKPVECMRRHELLPFLKESGNYPMTRYISKNDVTNEMTEKFSFRLEGKCFADAVDCAPADDDTNYTVLASELVERFGRDFTPYDISRLWVLLQSKEAYFTAERVAFKNFINGYVPPESAIYKNPFREWIGAQIRADYFGYINPGEPEKAAEMAWRDASVSHIKNGIYGEMFVAAMIAAAACTNDIVEIIKTGLGEIPENSRLHKAVENIICNFENGMPENEAFAGILEKWNDVEGYDWCHTISNAEIVVTALLYGNGDFSRSICLAVQTGFDTDCNGATVGSIVGMANGVACIGSEWLSPIKGKLHTGLFGMETVNADIVVERALKHAGY